MQYISHKEVTAYEVESVILQSGPAHARYRVVILGCPTDHIVSADTFSRFMPKKGDFLVIYQDGYVSASPRQAFLDGYKPKGETPVSPNPTPTPAGASSLETQILSFCDSVRSASDGRWLSIARTDIERGFMALRRAIYNGKSAENGH